MLLDVRGRVGEKVHQGIFYRDRNRVSGLFALANPRRIKASHRRRRKVASGPSVQRYYDPGIGRFLSVDPVTANANTGANFNRYFYANNNPYRFTDPDGRAPCDGPSTCAIDRDINAMNHGDMSRSEFMDRSEARAAGAAIGLAIVTLGRVSVALPALAKLAAPKLTDAQAKNLARFEKKFSRENRDVTVSKGKDGSVNLKNEVSGKVPGSKAVYEKTVDSTGKTTSATKTTIDPKGEVVHIKDKLR